MDGAGGIGCIRTAAEAWALLHPLRLRIVESAREPASATEIARRLGVGRQRVHYHARALAAAELLVPAGRRRRRNMVEQRWRARARFWVLAPELLGPLGLPADAGGTEEGFSPAALLALLGRAQAEVAGASSEAGGALPTLSLAADFRFRSANQQAAFAAALEGALATVIARHSEALTRPDGQPGSGRPFRLILGGYPLPDPSAGASGNVTPETPAEDDAGIRAGS